eukprot:COSAG06_NODE_1300_length_9944_cov_248.353784_5_plen_259_part_00
MPAPARRLAALRRHLARPDAPTAPRATHNDPAAASEAADGRRVAQLREYVSSGVVVLPPEEMGIPLDAHHGLYDAMCEKLNDKTLGSNLSYYEAVPALAHLFEAPGLVATLDNILGKDWAYVPFMHSMFVKAGDQDQGWHKDDNAIMNGRKLRHHRPMQVEVLVSGGLRRIRAPGSYPHIRRRRLPGRDARSPSPATERPRLTLVRVRCVCARQYYPQDTDLSFGPTCVLPYSRECLAGCILDSIPHHLLWSPYSLAC